MKIRGDFKTRSVVDQWSIQFRGYIIVWNKRSWLQLPGTTGQPAGGVWSELLEASNRKFIVILIPVQEFACRHKCLYLRVNVSIIPFCCRSCICLWTDNNACVSVLSNLYKILGDFMSISRRRKEGRGMMRKCGHTALVGIRVRTRDLLCTRWGSVAADHGG